MKNFSKLLSDTMDDMMGESPSEVGLQFHGKVYFIDARGDRREDWVLYAFLRKLLGSKQARTIHETSFRRLCTKLRREYEKVEGYFPFLDKLYKIKFKFLFSSLEQERFVCNRGLISRLGVSRVHCLIRILNMNHYS